MKIFFRGLSIVVLFSLLFGAAKTWYDLKALPNSAAEVTGFVQRQLIVDRYGQRLTASFENQWNIYDALSLPEFPELLVQAFITAEDRKFYDHAGVDWWGRMSALTQALRKQSISRGASTITEQVVRILHPRPRTFWSRWLETFEAYQLERRWDKSSILEFYLNQVPYGRQRRGVVQAARAYFGRDLSTLNNEETLALAVLVRAPSSLDPQQNNLKLLQRVQWLGERLHLAVNASDLKASLAGISQSSHVDVHAAHFAEFVRKNFKSWSVLHGTSDNARIETTLDGPLQNFTQDLLDNELKNLKNKSVNHAALLVVDNQSGEVLAWSVAGGTAYNTVLVPRQPGSALKPFLYGLALDKGWTASTLIVDEPLVTAVGTGVHAIRNYSREYYGAVTLREALGNSLNTPAIKAVKFVEPGRFLEFLKKAHFSTLDRSIDIYGEGLALGSAEVSLLEIVQAYTLFANEGHVRKLRWFREEPNSIGDNLLSSEASSLIGNILSDPKARALEFGRHSILNFPSPTAVKTGTATDYRDAWAFGYNTRFSVGVWMGDLDRRPTDGNTGARGPAIILRSVFNYLQQHNPDVPPLTPSPKLLAKEVCRHNGQVVLRFGHCDFYTEYFIPGTENTLAQLKSEKPTQNPRISFPVPHMQIAWDPRVAAKSQAIEFRIEHLQDFKKIEWSVNGQKFATSHEAQTLWPLRRGSQKLSARIEKTSGQFENLDEVSFVVK